MDNFDFFEHLAQTDYAKNASQELVESFVRSYYQEMHAVLVKWAFTLDFEYEDNCDEELEQSNQAVAELRNTQHKFWLPDSRFTEYWKPSFQSSDAYKILEPGITIFSDMLGNFVVFIKTSAKNPDVYLLSVIRDQLRIVNKFF